MNATQMYSGGKRKQWELKKATKRNYTGYLHRAMIGAGKAFSHWLAADRLLGCDL